MKNYIKIDGKKIEISDETAENLKRQFSDKIKIEEEFVWYKEENKDIDTSKIISIGGSADLRGCSGDLSSLESIDGYADLQGCSSDLSSLESIGSSAYLQGCSKELKKSLAKTLKQCGNISVEYQDEEMTLEEFREYAKEL
jgi:hypothetical protein